MDDEFIKISRKPKRNYKELLSDSSDFGSWVGSTDELIDKKKKREKKKREKKKRKLIREIENYEL